MTTIKTTHSMRAGLLAWLTAVACLLACALGASSAWGTYGDEYALQPAEGPVLPGPTSFWAGTCNLDEAPGVEQPIPGGVGSRSAMAVTNMSFFGTPEFGPAPTLPEDCLDLGVPDGVATAVSPWDTPPSWRLPAANQAGAHPDFTTRFTLTRDFRQESEFLGAMPSGSARDVQVALPRGLVGNLTGVATCPNSDFEPKPPTCPPQTQVGVANINTNDTVQETDQVLPVYNLEVLPGHVAEFGIPDVDTLTPIRIVAKDRTDSDFGITAGVERIPTGAPLLAQSLTFWGVPWAASHDAFRPRAGALETNITESGLEPAEQAHYERSWGPIEPFLTLPSSCTASGSSGPVASFAADSWQHPAATLPDGEPDLTPNVEEPLDQWVTADSELAPLDGCGKLGFTPTISFQPSTAAAESPSGLSVDLAVPQNNTPPSGLENNPSDSEGAPAWWKSEAGLASSDMKDITVTLPEGLTVNPSSAAGLESCSEEQVGLTSESPVSFDNDQPSCPEASALGTVEVDTPLLPEPLLGTVYLAAQDANPFRSLVALYLVVQDPERGLIVKLAGEAALDPVTGQITASFLNDPQLPFEHVKLVFKSGPRAPLVTPPTCGPYTTSSDIVPWAGPAVADATPSSSFQVDEGCATGGFAPSFTAGTSTPKSAGYSPLVVSFSRNDGEQDLAGIGVTLPPGLLGMISKVSQCGEPQASQGACPAASQIGTTTVTAGAGGSPLSLPEAGQPADPVFLTGPYDGAPFGLSILVHAKAGPFNLGDVVVRAKIDVNPHTAQVSVTSGELPHILDGVPVRLRSASVNVDRGEFIVNPTSCEPSSVSGTIASLQGASAPVSSPFTAVNCASLKFTPKFSVSTSAKTSKAGGASLTTKLTEPSEAQGSQANIAKVKVELPKALPSRLTTLQKACMAAQFEANPAGCPSASKIGSATVNTPILPVPLSGPAIFVSHGGEAFPSLTLVLQGDGVTIDLVGTTFISKAGVTSTTFKTVPDAPFSTFTLTLPEGKYSALAANGNLCAQKLTMPTEFIAQNGAAIHQSTPIAVEGCSTSLSFTHTIKKKTLMLSVYAPAAGKVTASGKGLSSQTKTAKGQEKLTFTLKQKKAGKLRTTVKVAFTPSTGKDRKKQAKSAKLRFEK